MIELRFSNGSLQYRTKNFQVDGSGAFCGLTDFGPWLDVPHFSFVNECNYSAGPHKNPAWYPPSVPANEDAMYRGVEKKEPSPQEKFYWYSLRYKPTVRWLTGETHIAECESDLDEKFSCKFQIDNFEMWVEEFIEWADEIGEVEF